MYIKIYFNDKPVILCDKINNELDTLSHQPGAIHINEPSATEIHSLLKKIKEENFERAVLYSDDIKRLKEAFFKNFTVIEAAGGIVQNSDKQLLFIYRFGKWDLPKGKIEEDETAEQAVLREVTEETGVVNMQLKKKTGTTYHVYENPGNTFLKITHWYYITCPAEQHLKPQQEEDITDIKWISTNHIKEPVANTYASIKDILSEFFDAP